MNWQEIYKTKILLILLLIGLFLPSLGYAQVKQSRKKAKKLIQQTMEMEKVNRVVTKLFVASDQRDWETVESSFADKVLLDYSSMNGNPAATLTPKEITTAWKGILPGFTHTHHQLGNFIKTVNGNKAHVFCYGTATHYLEDEKGNIWTVVGSYDFDLKLKDKVWKIISMKFNFKYQDGNETLPEKAIENAKSKQQ